ncbi:asparaginase [Ideonella sp. 4Y11]|uniref:Asparaginase n=1 Tax=Ideonella aquatica TaxID=2824119 RepID=A0A940YSH6_9BURK|nr:asparaginase [Ideonella aquatica]MBQ0958570.1 asparaginase [Ideonella aquatica]
MSNPVLVEALRGDTVESAHRGALVVVDADGATVLALGDVQRPVFPRSAVKLLQALPLVASGAAERWQLTDAELALACASHGGEPAHVATAAGLLARLGLDASVLECGAHWPGHEPATRALARSGAEPSALHNNCSGKHSGLACLGCLLAGGADARGFLSGYTQPQHPVMREVSAALQAATGHDLAHAPMGIDGCSIPTFAIPLQALARGFARVATGQGLSAGHAVAARRLRRAIAAQPFMVAGSGRLDTDLMAHFGERLCCKVGAEGVYCAALPELGWGLAIKVDDGNNARAAEVVLASVAQALLVRDEADAAVLAPRVAVTLRNWRGTAVGALRPASSLQQALATLAR